MRFMNILTPFAVLLLTACGGAEPAEGENKSENGTSSPSQDVTITYKISDSMENEKKLKGLSQTIYYSRTGSIRDENSGAITITRPDLNKEFRYQQGFDGKITLLVERNLEEGELPINRFNEWEDVKKIGTSEVAGRSCTLWNQAVDQQDWTVCLTDDNLVLQIETKSKLGDSLYTTRHVATAIKVEEIDPKLFEPIR